MKINKYIALIFGLTLSILFSGCGEEEQQEVTSNEGVTVAGETGQNAPQNTVQGGSITAEATGGNPNAVNSNYRYTKATHDLQGPDKRQMAQSLVIRPNPGAEPVLVARKEVVQSNTPPTKEELQMNIGQMDLPQTTTGGGNRQGGAMRGVVNQEGGIVGNTGQPQVVSENTKTNGVQQVENVQEPVVSNRAVRTERVENVQEPNGTRKPQNKQTALKL